MKAKPKDLLREQDLDRALGLAEAIETNPKKECRKMSKRLMEV